MGIVTFSGNQQVMCNFAQIIPKYHNNLPLSDVAIAIFEILHLICVIHDNAMRVVTLMYTKQFVSYTYHKCITDNKAAPSGSALCGMHSRNIHVLSYGAWNQYDPKNA